MRHVFFLSGFAVLLLSGSCATKKITFFSNEPANVSIVPFSDASGEGSLIGQAPVTVEVDRIAQGYIKVWGEKMETQYWVITDLLGENTQANIKLKKVESPEKNDEEKKDEEKDKEDKDAEKKDKDNEAKKQEEDRSIEQNKNFRLMLKAYEALAKSHWQEARDLSSELSKALPNVAAPHIIMGLAFLSEGNKSAANSSFSVAKTLDPIDAEIEKLLKLSQQ